jgi:hypothetical protein
VSDLQPAAPVLVKDWWDGFTFASADAEIWCPDCDEASPELANIYEAAQWVEQHLKECPEALQITSDERRERMLSGGDQP